MKTHVTIENLIVAYEDKPVLFDIDLTINRGQLIAIVGPNGAGKSTLIKAMINLVKKTTGHVFFDGKTYEDYKKNIAYVPQRNTVDWDFPTTVKDVVLMGRYHELKWYQKPSKTYISEARAALEKVGMLALENRQISKLSGGQQQRVFLARALFTNASLYLMDEPFQGVDDQTEKAIIDVLRLLKQEKKTVLVVHHDLSTVSDYFDEVILINKRLIAHGNVKDVFTNENIVETFKGIKTRSKIDV